MFGDNDSYGLVYLLVSVGVLILIVLCTCLEWKEAKKREEQQKVSIFMYLQQFDVEDIDLRKSPPGGWHGTYMHKLAYGINQASRRSGGGGMISKPPPHPHYASSDDDDDESFYTHQTSHSSTARDSTFMDISPTSTSPSSGGGSSYHRDRQEPVPLLGYDEFESRNTNPTGSSPSAVSSETNKMRMII